jgi:hypothetical protein
LFENLPGGDLGFHRIEVSGDPVTNECRR